MNQRSATFTTYRLCLIVLLLIMLFSLLGLGTVFPVQAQSPKICLLDGTVQIPLQGLESLRSALAMALGNVDFHGAECFAPIDLRDEGEWHLLTLIGLVGVQPGSEWTAPSKGVWSDLALIRYSGTAAEAAVAGTTEFSHLLAEIPENVLSQDAQNALDPLVPNSPVDTPVQPATFLDSYVFPFESGRLVKFFRFHFNTNDNYPFWTGSNSKAVDLGSDGNTGVNHAPNRLLAVASGWVRHRCSEEGLYSSTYIAVENDDGAKVIYAHINKAEAPAVGTRVLQGQYLGTLKTGDFADDVCGHSDQQTAEFHVHFEAPNTTSLTLSDWTLNTSTGTWSRGNETWTAGEYKQIGTNNGSFFFNDEFNNPTLDPRWHWYREDSSHWSLNLAPGYLRIVTQPKDIWRGSNNAPLLLQTYSSNDFHIQTRITINPVADHHQGGLVIYSDDDNYVRFTYAHIDGLKFEFAKETVGNFQPIQIPAPPGINDFHLRIAKVGTSYSAYYSQDGISWTWLSTHENVSISPVEVGLLAFNAVDVTLEEIPADFDYFRLQKYSFHDVPASYWSWEYIERLLNSSITGGCSVNPLNYCPEVVVTRAQMAVFLERAMHGSSYTPPLVGSNTGFGDVPADHWAGAWIKQLAAEGITSGCGAGLYCPEGAVTRAQMAVFLLRSKYGSSYTPPPVGGSTGFSDVSLDYWAGAWIKQLVAEGITSGCGAGTYCPESPVTRAQMAVFLVRTFNLP